MARVVSVHSFRGGTGKSNVTANLATTIARQGQRVGIIDTDIQSPGIHVLFGLDEEAIDRSLNDYLWGNCPIDEAAPCYKPAREVVDVLHEGQLMLVFPVGREMEEMATAVARLAREPEDELFARPARASGRTR